MAFIREYAIKKHNFYLCISKKEDESSFSCHLYNKVENTVYVGLDKIKSKKTTYMELEYELIIPIKETVYEEIYNMNFVEIIHLGINGILQKYNLDEYAV
jgi:hypothetical protein